VYISYDDDAMMIMMMVVAGCAGSGSGDFIEMRTRVKVGHFRK
jgi:hypothetical protein